MWLIILNIGFIILYMYVFLLYFLEQFYYTGSNFEYITI